MNFLEKLDYMMEKLSINKNQLSKLSGVPYTTIDSFYKKGYENTKISTIRKIAVALDVSLDYLVDDNISDETYSIAPPCESDLMLERIIRNYRKLNEEGKEKLMDYSDDLVAGGRYIKSSQYRMGKEA